MSTPRVVRGWKAIATVLGVSTRGAQKRALRDIDPLPVRLGHKGPWAYYTALRDWIFRQDLAYDTVTRLRREARAAVNHARARQRSRRGVRASELATA